jgi:asparagine synthase (glutamine-hydrolysing)
MCGITGILAFDRQKKIDPAVLSKMTDVIAYRGPDGFGYYNNANIALGHRRLSIIDLSTGDQPMFSDDGTIVLVFNGEIYNYIELREDLIKLGYHFKTNSDTEVIIKAYQHWGIDCQNKFNGMWSFALWDDKKQQLLLSRDRIGEKPLHYCVHEDSIIFGSEIKSIFAYGVPKVPNLELIEIYLCLSFIPAPFTFYKNIKKLKAGHCLVICGSDVKEKKYWDLPEIDEHKMLTDKQAIYKNFESLFTDSLKIRMRSDAPYGAFLSGGLDSSTIVALMAENSNYPVETFTIGFKEKAFDERHLAKMVADKFSTSHHEYIVEPESFDEALHKIIHHYDEPFGDSSAIPTGHVSKFAVSNKVKMVLTGDGGDELLSGYTTYQGEKFSEQYQALPKWIKNRFPGFVSKIASPFRGSVRYKLNRVQDVCELANMDFESRYLNKVSSIDVATIKQMTKGRQVFPIEEFLKGFMQGCTYKDSFYKLMYMNIKLTLPDDMLVKVDRMSMAYSLETRAPFLDYRLIEYMVGVDKKVKMQGYERKSILKNSIAKKLPDALLNAPKKGFRIPLREWFKDEGFATELNELVLTNLFTSKEMMQQIIDLNKAGKKDYGNFIWGCLVLNKILNNNPKK